MIRPLPRRRFQVLSLALENEVGASEADDKVPAGGIYLRRPGTNSGPYSPGEIKEALARDRISATDLAWHKGLADWMPLATVLNSVHESVQATGGTSTSSTNVFYSRLTTAFLTSVTELLSLLEEVESAPVPQAGINKLEVFLDAFPRRAADFNTRCSSMVAVDVRHATTINAIKNTPSGRLTIEMRETVFKDLDAALKQWRVNPSATSDYGEQLFNLFLAALRNLATPLIDYASSKCFGTAIDRQKQRACAQACSTRCGEMIEQAVRKFSAAFGECDSKERRIARLVQMQQKHVAGMKGGCAAALALIVGLLVILATFAHGLSDTADKVLCLAVAVLMLACISNLLKLLGF